MFPVYLSTKFGEAEIRRGISEFGLTSGVSGANLILGDHIFVVPEPRIDGCPETWISRLKERIKIPDIPDPFICNSWNLIYQKVPGLALPVLIGKVCGFLNKKKLDGGF